MALFRYLKGVNIEVVNKYEKFNVNEKSLTVKIDVMCEKISVSSSQWINKQASQWMK